MPRRIKPKETKRDWRWWANILLNSAVVLSMVLGTVIVFAGVPTSSQSAPPSQAPTVAPTILAPPTVPLVTPTPKASADYQIAVAGKFP
jgi:hypothetical protein